MLISARYLVDRLRHPRSRADQLRDLRARLAKLPGTPGQEERSLAAALRRTRVELSAALEEAGASACGSCTAGHPLPASRWSGGHCCSGDTADVFTDTELAALAAGGTRPGDLVGPRDDHAGCAFRGSRGCSLSPADRPTVCARYLCRDLRADLFARDAIDRVMRLVDRLYADFGAFAAARERRLADEEINELERLEAALAHPSQP